MSEPRVETAAGILVLLALAVLAYPAVRVGERGVLGVGTHRVVARFDSAGGLEPGAPVEIAGVPVGRVESVRLDHRYYADVTMRIAEEVVLRDDATVAIKSTGLIGEEYVSITPGTSHTVVKDGGRIRKTQDAVDLEDLIAQFVQGTV